jgi:hypothetical protein
MKTAAKQPSLMKRELVAVCAIIGPHLLMVLILGVS